MLFRQWQGKDKDANQGSKTIQNKQSLFSLRPILVFKNEVFLNQGSKAILVYTRGYKPRFVFPKQTYRETFVTKAVRNLVR